MASAATRLLAAHAALPEPYQPAWGLDASRGVARRGCDDRLAVILPLLRALPCDGTLRILDLGCAQGYFTLAIAHALGECGREFEIVGVDYLEDNIRFCQALAAHHRLPATFLHARVDAGFLERAGDAGRDAVLALSMLHHVQCQRGDAGGVLGAIRAHSRVAFCELAQRDEALDWVGDWHGADEQLLGEFAFRRCLASFPTHLGKVRRPLHVCSDALAWVGDRWFGFDRTAGRSHAGVPDAFIGQRRFLFGRDVVVKAYRGEGDYGAFNRAELEAEAVALAALPGEPDRYPEVLGRADDGDTVWLARGMLQGRLLSECIDAGEHIDQAAVVLGLLGELSHLESKGFHHGDLRCWNVLVDGGRVRLIDFGALVRKPAPLHRVALAAVLLEICKGGLRHEQPYYASLHPLSAYPPAWRGLVRYLLETSQRTFRFARALEVAESALPHDPRKQDRARLMPAVDVMTAVAKEQVDGFRRMREHAAEFERGLADVRRESVDASADRAALENARRAAEAHALELNESLEQSQRYARSLAQSLEESRAFAESLQARMAREASEASAEREALREARIAATEYADSLKAALAESKEFVEALQSRIAREAADADRERKATQASQRQAAAHAAALEKAARDSEAHASSLAQALATSQAFADSLQAALGESQAYASSLEARIERESAEAKAEREAIHAAQRDAAAHADALKASLEESRAYASSLEARIERESAEAKAEREAAHAAQRDAAAHADALKASLEESRAYASSLEARIERESAEAKAEREALLAKQREMIVQIDLLAGQLKESQAYADALKASQDESQAYASSLEARIRRESVEAEAEREAARVAQHEAATYVESLKGEVDLARGESEALRQVLARMRHRFRLLKILWPHEVDDSREPE